MKKGLYVLLFLIFVLSTSMTIWRRLNISVRVENIDIKNDSLKLEFAIDYPDLKKKIYFDGKIEVLKNDSLFLRFVADSIKNPIESWTFPSIPDGYRIAYSEGMENLPYFDKTDNLTFIFSIRPYYYEKWEYKSYYSDKRARWLFDEKGTQKVTIKSNYEPYLFGKDAITINANMPIFIENLDVQLLDKEGKPLEFEIKHKGNPTHIIELKLKKKEKKGTKLNLIIDFDKEKHYEECISVPDRSNVIIG